MAAKIIPFDDSSRFVFFSDCHRGDNSRADAFARNKPLFLHALTHYYHEGFTYVEVGDGDELWKNRRFSVIRQAHESVFNLLHEFDRLNRLHLIVGNHDIGGRRHHKVEKDGIPTEEALVLQHAEDGQQVFVVHGHQGDLKSDALYLMSRFMVRYVWRRLQDFGLLSASSRSRSLEEQAKKTEHSITEWVQAHRQVTICGHTHQPRSTRYGAAPYFNTGSCAYPGYMTGLELQDGELTLVKWTAHANGNGRNGGSLHVQREVMVPPRKLSLFG
jgi:UDP-2,3-diacylglucosamine pyrophosphatase LpxH